MINFKYLFTVITAAGSPGFTHGFHSGVLNIFGLFLSDWYAFQQIKREHAMKGFYELWIMDPFMKATFGLGAIVGSLFIAVSVNNCGRKGALLAQNGIALLGVALLSLAYITRSFEVFLVGRGIMGVAVGLSSGASLIYLDEIALEDVRGVAGSVYYLMFCIGVSTSYVFGLPEVLGKKSWWLLFFLGGVPPLLQIIMLMFCPESPRFLLFDKEDEEGAEEAIEWLDRPNMEERIYELKEEELMLEDIGEVNCGKLLTDQNFRSPLIISVVMMIGQKLSGIDAALLFSLTTMSEWNFSPQVQRDCTIGLSFVNLFASIICMCLIDRIGRIPLLLGSFGGMAASMFGIGLSYLLWETLPEEEVSEDVFIGCIFFFFLFVLCYGLGAGAIPPMYTAEICNYRARPATMSMAVCANWVIHLLIVMTFKPLMESLGTFTFLLYGVFDVIILVFLLFTMRETMDVPATEILEMFYD